MNLMSVVAALALTVVTPLLGQNGVKVLDGNKKDLGTLVGLTPGLSPRSFNVFRSGYFIAMRFDGYVQAAFDPSFVLMWTGPNCTGGVFLLGGPNDAISTHIVLYSGQANQFYVPSGSGALTTPQTVTGQSFEQGTINLDGGSICYNTGDVQFPVWELSPFDVKEKLGWDVSGNPARVAAPITLSDGSRGDHRDRD
jgi:hypothetical protein